MLVELGLVEQRYQAVLEVLNDGVPIVEVAARLGVTRQSVHRWLKRYAARGLAGLVDGSTVPGSCPHQMSPIVEARIVEMLHEGSQRSLVIEYKATRRSGRPIPLAGCEVCRFRDGKTVNLGRYPHFVSDDGPDEVLPSGPPTGRRTDGKMRRSDVGTDRSILEKKFPALRGH